MMIDFAEFLKLSLEELINHFPSHDGISGSKLNDIILIIVYTLSLGIIRGLRY